MRLQVDTRSEDDKEGEEGEEGKSTTDVASERVQQAAMCPVCLDWLKPPIISMCASGHSICTPCYAQANPIRCVVCKERSIHNGTRNVPMEGLVAALKPKLTCPDCNGDVNYDDMLEHRLTCVKIPCVCPHDGCSMRTQRSGIVEHLVQQHHYQRVAAIHTSYADITCYLGKSEIVKMILRNFSRQLMVCIRYVGASRSTTAPPSLTVQAVYLGDDFDTLDDNRKSITICYKAIEKNGAELWDVTNIMTTKVNVVPWPRPFRRDEPYVNPPAEMPSSKPFRIHKQADDTFQLYVLWGAHPDGVTIPNWFLQAAQPDEDASRCLSAPPRRTTSPPCHSSSRHHVSSA